MLEGRMKGPWGGGGGESDYIMERRDNCRGDGSPESKGEVEELEEENSILTCEWNRGKGSKGGIQ